MSDTTPMTLEYLRNQHKETRRVLMGSGCTQLTHQERQIACLDSAIAREAALVAKVEQLKELVLEDLCPAHDLGREFADCTCPPDHPNRQAATVTREAESAEVVNAAYSLGRVDERDAFLNDLKLATEHAAEWMRRAKVAEKDNETLGTRINTFVDNSARHEEEFNSLKQERDALAREVVELRELLERAKYYITEPTLCPDPVMIKEITAALKKATE